MTTLTQVHSRCICRDRKLRISGVMTDVWYSDRMLSYVRVHRFAEVEITEETDDLITVKLL